jgi:hypothetical protein
MRKMFLVLLICTICIGSFVSYIFHKIYYSNNISIRINDSDDLYRIYAYFPQNKTYRLQRLMDEKLHSRMFNHARINGYLTLEDKTHLYINTAPGRLVIRFNKRENDEESCFRLRELGEGIKLNLAEN